MENGQWNPPESNERIDDVLSVFYHLSKKRQKVQHGMNGIIGDDYLYEAEITAYFIRNEPSFDFDWFQRLLYAADDKYIELSRAEYEKRSAK